MNKLEKLDKLMNILTKYQRTNIETKMINVYGFQYNYQHQFMPSVSLYWFGPHIINEAICPLNNESKNNNRPGDIKKSTEYIVIHDTCNASPTADAQAHANYVKNGGDGTSWHYSAGDDGIYHQIPDDEVAYHAGDGLMVPFSLINTGVLVNDLQNENVKISIKDGYFYLNEIKTLIKVPTVEYKKVDGTLIYSSNGIIQKRKAPEGSIEGKANIELTTAMINDYGLFLTKDNDGYFYMGPVYYNASFNRIANRGGNLHSIGIETMVNKGCNLNIVWHKCAKLVAHLLVDNQLTLDRVKPHHYFSGKNCPMTMRENNMWAYFMSLVEAEYEVLINKDDIEIIFISDNDIVDNNGEMITIVNKPCEITYTIKLKDKEGNELVKHFHTNINIE